MTEVLHCHVCETGLDDPIIWRSQGEAYCARHKPEQGDLVLALGSGSERVVRGAVHPETTAVFSDLANASKEVLTAKEELEAFRHMLNEVETKAPLNDGPRLLGAGRMVAGDKTDFVLARDFESGARIERQLVGLRGALRLIEKGQEDGVSQWSVAEGKLVSVEASVPATAGLAFHLKLEGPHSELQVWCRTEEQMDAWLVWTRRHHPNARISRRPEIIPDAESSFVPTPKRPSAFRAQQNTLRSRISRKISAQSIDVPSASPMGATANASDNKASAQVGAGAVSGDEGAPNNSMERKFGKTVFGWAKKHLQSARNSGAVKQLDVFTASLDDLMEEQRLAVSEASIPLLLSFLADSILNCEGEQTEGIFRISASHDEVADVVRAIRKVRGYDYQSACDFSDPHVPAALLKQWLRDLPVPLFEDYFKCIEISKMVLSQQNGAYKEMMLSLSDVHRHVVIFLIRFLIKVGDKRNVPFTKMPLANLALVFVPSFLRCPNQADISLVLTNQPSEQNFVQTLVELAAQDGWLDFLEEEDVPY